MGRFEAIIFNINIFIIISFLAMHLVGCGDSSTTYAPTTPTLRPLGAFDPDEVIQYYRDQCEDQAESVAESLMPMCEIKYGNLGANYCPSLAATEILKQMNSYDSSAAFFLSSFNRCGDRIECAENLDLELSSIIIRCGTYSF